MTFSYNVHLPNGQTIGVSDDEHGDARMEELYQKYGNLQIDAYDRNDVWGKGFDAVEPMTTLTIEEFFS